MFTNLILSIKNSLLGEDNNPEQNLLKQSLYSMKKDIRIIAGILYNGDIRDPFCTSIKEFFLMNIPDIKQKLPNTYNMYNIHGDGTIYVMDPYKIKILDNLKHPNQDHKIGNVSIELYHKIFAIETISTDVLVREFNKIVKKFQYEDKNLWISIDGKIRRGQQ